MKSTGRVRLYCAKRLPCGVIDRFTVVVMTAKKDAAKKEYESQGYKVY